MVEIENKYKILDKKFGYINWLGFFTLYQLQHFLLCLPTCLQFYLQSDLFSKAPLIFFLFPASNSFFFKLIKPTIYCICNEKKPPMWIFY